MKTKSPPCIEPLEDRIAPATLTWDGSVGDGNWFDGQNWDQNAVPGAGDTAILAIGSTINLTSDATVGAFQQSAGTLTGPATLTILGDLSWSGGTMDGTGTTAIGAGATLTLATSANKALLRTLVNNGTADWTGGGVAGSGTFTNNGAFNASAGNSFFPTFTNAPGATFNQLSATNGFQGTFNNNGAVNVTGGTLNFGGGAGTHTGMFNVATALNFAAGTHQLNGATISGAGDVGLTTTAITFDNTAIYNVSGTTAVTSGTVTLNSSSTAIFGTLNQSGGTLTGNANLQVNTAATWSAGTMSGAGTTTIVPSATLTLSGASTKTLNRQLVNQGATNWTGGAVGGSGLFTNNNLFTASAGNSFNPPFSNTAAATFTQSAGTNTFTGALTNGGAINIDAGTFAPNGGFAQTAGAVSLNGGAVSTTGALSFNGGELRGVGTITGNVDNSGATVRPGGTGAVGAIDILGTYTQAAGGALAVEIGGPGPGQFDRLNASMTVTIAGTLSAALINGFTPAAGAQFQVLAGATRSGTFANVTGPLSAQYNAANVTLVAVAATIFTWDAGGGADTSWFTPANWSPDGVPGAADTAILNIDATINLPSDTSVGTFMQSNPSFVGANAIFTSPAGVTLTILNAFTWTGGTQSGAGATTVVAGATFTHQTDGQDTPINQHTLNLNGTAIFPSSFTSGMALSNGATINNSGVMDFQGPVVFSGTGTFNNLAGATLKSTTTNHTIIVDNGIPFTNAGTVRVLAGTFGVNGGYTQTAGSTEFSGGGFVNVSGALALNGGVLAGSGNFGGSINNSGGIVRPGRAGAAGTITTNGDYIQGTGGTLETDLGGTTSGQFDLFAVGGLASLSGTLTAPFVDGVTPPPGSAFQVITAGSSVSGRFDTAPANLGIQYGARDVTLVAPAAPPVIVTTALDVVDSADGLVSLREAITIANSAPGLDSIAFNIPGSGVHTIEVGSELPALTEAVIIDGYTQPGASPNQLAAGNDALLLIELSGSLANVANGLGLNAGDSVVRGLIINGFSDDGLVLNGPGNDVVAGNWIGVDFTGMAAKPNRNDGILVNAPNVTIGGLNPADRNVISGNGERGIELSGGVGGMIVQGNYIGTNAVGTAAVGNGDEGIVTGTFNVDSPNVVIGGNIAGARNVISGNLGAGVHVHSDGVVIQGNYIGTDFTGMLPLRNITGVTLNSANNALVGGNTPAERNIISGNSTEVLVLSSHNSTISGNYLGVAPDGLSSLGGGTGVQIDNSSATLVGGTIAGTGNVISGHTDAGILITNSSSTRVEGNIIGMDASGTVALPNQFGIRALSASSVVVGSTQPFGRNVIAFNDGEGIAIDDLSRGVSVLNNSIHDNEDLGIDLGDDGITTNDLGDADSGGNDQQNFPVLTQAGFSGGDAVFDGSLNSAPLTIYTLQFYGSLDADPTGFGEGAVYLGSMDVTTDSNGNATFRFAPLPAVAAGASITATATDPSGNTSEFSAAIVLQGGTPTEGGRSVTVTEADGDRVTIKLSKGSIPAGAIVLGANGIELVDLRSVVGLGQAVLTISADQSGDGDGLVNVGAINASGIDLSKIRVDGDLGQIDIGSGDPRKPALKSLSVASLGTQGASTQTPGTQNPLLSEVNGSLGELNVKRDVQNAVVNASGKIGKVLIGGNLIDNAPALAVERRFPSIGVFLNGGIPPPNASHAGAIFAPDIGSVTVMGDIDGGEIGAETAIKKVKIVGKLMSDDPLDPAILRVGAAIAKVIINGDVENALILAGYNRALEPNNPDAAIGKVTVKGDWTASSLVAGIADPGDNGFGINDTIIPGDDTEDIVSRIGSVVIKGTASGSATLSDHSAITAQKLGALRINGAKVPLTKGPDNLGLDALRDNFRAVEVS